MADYLWGVKMGGFFCLLYIFVSCETFKQIICLYIIHYEKKYIQWSQDIPLSFQFCGVLGEKTERTVYGFELFHCIIFLGQR